MNHSAVKRINDLFQQSIDLHEQSLEMLATHLVSASEVITAGLLDGGKVMTCGSGDSCIEAMNLSATLLNGLERERPGLPAVSLGTNSPTAHTSNSSSQIDNIYARQVHALANPNDILVIFSINGQSPDICKAIDAAHQYKVPVILFSGGDGGQAAKLIEDGDCELRVPSREACRIREVHMLLVHCLGDYVDSTLFSHIT